MALVTIPPILSCVVISLSALRRPFLACWVLPSLAVLAAMRIDGLVQTYAAPKRIILPTMSLSHAPCSPSA